MPQSRVRIPQRLEQADKLVFGRSVLDILIFGLIPILGVTLLAATGILTIFGFISSLTFVILGCATLFYVVGPGTSLPEWLNAQIHSLRLPEKATPKALADGAGQAARLGTDAMDIIDDFTTNPANVRFWEADKSTADFLKIQHVYPQLDILELDDGRLVTALEVSGTNLFLRDGNSKQNLVDSFANALNTIENPLTVMITTETFDFEDHVDHHREMYREEEILTNVIMREMATEYENKVLTDSRVANTKERGIYVIIGADPENVETDYLEDDESPLDNIAAYVWLKEQFGGQTNPEDDFSNDELANLQATSDTLLKRKRRVATQLGGIPGVETHTCGYADHLGIYKGHWDDPMQSVPVHVPASAIRTTDG